MKKVFFRFYEELNDFLPSERQKVQFSYEYILDTSVKDCIESLGVPHSEIDLILVNGQPVDFNYLMHEGDTVSVYPEFESFDITADTKVRDSSLREPKFVVDIQLGKLAKYLRMFGFDTLYNNRLTNYDIIKLSLEQKRAILTKSINLLKRKEIVRGYWLRSYYPQEQISEVLKRFDLKNKIKEFTRCIICNSELHLIEKSEIIDTLPLKVIEQQNIFLFCPDCKKAYWKGTHYNKMSFLINTILSKI